MTSCRPLKKFDASGLADWGTIQKSGANTEFFESTGQVGIDSYCAPSGPRLALAGFSQTLALPRVLAAPAVAKPSLPPPPKNPIARVLYDLTTQLKDFQMNIDIDIPVEGLDGGGPVDAMIQSVLGDKGAVIRLEAEFKPGLQFRYWSGWGIPVLKQVAEYFTGYRVLRVFKDPKSKKIQARIDYRDTYFGKNPDAFLSVHNQVVKKLKLSDKTVARYDLKKGLPEYSWEMLDLLFTALDERQQQKNPPKIGFEKARPLWDKGEISIEGNFSNQTVSLPGFKVHFAKLPADQKHRITVKGKLLEPVITIQGLATLEVDNPKAKFRLVNAQPNQEPLKIIAKIDPSGKTPTRLHIPHYQSEKVYLETEPKGDPDLKLRFDLREGIEIKGLTFWLDPKDPRMDIKKLVAKQIAFDGFGLHLETNAGDQATFQDVHLHRHNGQIHFNSSIEGKGNGEISYQKDGQEIGKIQFRYLEGQGRLRVEPEGDEPAKVELSGNVSAELPEIRLRVRAEKIASEVTTDLQDASVSGTGKLAVWPTQKRVLLESEEGESFHIHGKKGRVRFHQDPSKVEKWPELKEQLGEDLSQSVVSDLFVDLKEIDFDLQKAVVLSLIAKEGRGPSGSEKPALEIEEALLGPIKIVGDVYGHAFVRIPGGLYYPLVIGQTFKERKKCRFDPKTQEYDAKSCTFSAKMKDAEMEIGTLSDQKDDAGRRKVKFTGISLSGEESKPTFSKQDKKICRGVDRQHIHAKLGIFQFSPDDRDFRIDEVDPHFHIFLNDLIQGGCLLIGDIPKKP